jgi:hypothetical protein
MALAGLAGCAAADPADTQTMLDREVVSAVSSPSLPFSVSPSVCSYSEAGDGWTSRLVQASAGLFDVRFRAYPTAVQGTWPPTLSGVIGLAKGPASDLTDLAVLVRFSAEGYIDVRDGDVYTGGFPYVVDDFPYDFEIAVNLFQGRYSVWVRHLDSPNKPFQSIALDVAIGGSPGEALDTLSTVIDSAEGALAICGLSDISPLRCLASDGGVPPGEPCPVLPFGGRVPSLESR